MRSSPLSAPAARCRAAFTLIELLVVITIIGVLAGVALPVFGSIQLAGKKTQSLSNMRQLGTALTLYCGQNEGKLPTEDDAGNSTPTWAQTTDNNTTVWYNALPRLGGFPAVADFAANASSQADYYTKKNLLYVPAAKYPSDKLTIGKPYFAIAFCSKFNKGVGGASIDPASGVIRLPNFQQPARTVALLETGLRGEKTITASQTYTGECKSYATRAIARYSGKSLVVFLDGHADTLTGTDLVDPATSKGYAPPALGATDTRKVIWTMMPDGDPR